MNNDKLDRLTKRHTSKVEPTPPSWPLWPAPDAADRQTPLNHRFRVWALPIDPSPLCQ